MEKLKRCPFDGAKAIIKKYPQAGWCICCSECAVEVYGATTLGDIKNGFRHKYWTKKQTVEAWNRRQAEKE